MPFTFSHPAAVLPFSYLPKRFISMTGLVAGSMAPDFEYFFRMNGTSIYSHTWAGVFYFDLPLTILLAFLYHTFIRNIFFDNLPGILARRLLPFNNFNWTKYFKQNILVVVLSIIAGVATHLILDGFTHPHGTFVEMFKILKKHPSIAGHHIPLFILMQHAGTVGGGLLVLYALLQLPAKGSIAGRRSIFPYWLLVTVISSIIILIRLYIGHIPRHFDDKIVILISGGLFGLVLTSLLFRYNFFRGINLSKT